MRIPLLLSLSGLLLTGLQAGDITGVVDCQRIRSNQNAVVYLETVPGEASPPAEAVVMDQKGLEFHPHVLPVVAGTAVDFVNSDDVLHNVFSPDKCANSFDLGTYQKGIRRSHRFDQVGCFPVVLCNVHPEMEAWILVLENSYWAVTDATGAFTIINVPAGTYTLVAWHERLKSRSQTITVPESGSVTANFTLTRR